MSLRAGRGRVARSPSPIGKDGDRLTAARRRRARSSRYDRSLDRLAPPPRRPRRPPRRRHLDRVRAGPRQRLHQLRRQQVHPREPRDARRPHRRRPALGDHGPVLQLASADSPLAHARLRALRTRSGRSPPDERPPPHRQHPAPVRLLRAHHGRAVGERRRRRAVRGPPHARRVGGLDRRAQGRPEHPLLAGGDVRVRALRRATVAVALRRGRGRSRLRPDVEADARHAAARPGPARRVAARAHRARAAAPLASVPAARVREAAPLRARRPRHRRRPRRPAAAHDLARQAAVRRPRHQRPRVVHHLPGQARRTARARGVLSAATDRAVGGGHQRRRPRRDSRPSPPTGPGARPGSWSAGCGSSVRSCR